LVLDIFRTGQKTKRLSKIDFRSYKFYLLMDFDF
jgi:hypothetical protein